MAGSCADNILNPHLCVCPGIVKGGNRGVTARLGAQHAYAGGDSGMEAFQG